MDYTLHSYTFKDINFAELFSISNKVHTITFTTSCLLAEQKKQLNQLLARYENVFSNTLSELKGPATIHFKSGATPVFARPREIPLVLREAYAKEIDTKIASSFYREGKAFGMGIDNTCSNKKERQDTDYWKLQANIEFSHCR